MASGDSDQGFLSRQAKEELRKAQKQQGAWIIGAASVRLAKICTPRCMTFESMAVSKAEEACIDSCVKSMHKTHLRTL